MRTKLLFVLLLSGMSAYAEPTVISDADDLVQSVGRRQKSYENEVLSGQEYYHAALRGELLDRTSDSDNALTLSENGSYQDFEGNLWFVEEIKKKYGDCRETEEEMLVNKYLGLKIMNLLVGPWSKEGKLLKDMPGYIAIKPLPKFSEECNEYERYSSKRYKLEIAMDFVGLRIPYFRDPFCNTVERSRFVIDNLLVKPCRQDFEFSLFYATINWRSYLHFFQDVKGARMAVESIVNISDDQILYFLGDCYNDLLKINAKLDDERYKNLGSVLIERKRRLEKLYKILLILEKIETNPKSYSSLDGKELSECINITLIDYARKSKLDNYVKFLEEKAVKNESGQKLLKACKDNNLKEVKYLLENNLTSIDYEDEKGCTALDRAFRGNEERCTLRIWQKGPFDSSRLELIAFLLENGANPHILRLVSEIGSFFVAAIEKGLLDLVKSLLAKGVSPNIYSLDDHTPLSIATKCNNLEIVNLLLEKGATANVKCGSGIWKTPLYIAIEKGCLEIAKVLLVNNADTNFQESSHGWTALQFAAMHNKLDEVKLLLEHNTDPNFIGWSGKAPLHSAVAEKHVEIVQILLQNGADPNIESHGDYLRPLHYAAEADHLEILNLLLENGADPNLKDSRGLTPLDIAKKFNHLEIEQLLIKKIDSCTLLPPPIAVNL